MYLLLRSNPHENNAVRFWFLFRLDICLFRVWFGSFLDFPLFRLSDCLCMLLFVYARLSGVWSLLLRISRVFQSSARKVTLWSYSSIPSFYYALVLPSKICMSRIGNMWFGCSTWGRNLLPLITPGIYVMLIYCLAMLVEGDWFVRFMKVVRDNNFGQH